AQFAAVRKATGNNFDRAEPLPELMIFPTASATVLTPLVLYGRSDRDGYTQLWMRKSDELCSQYKAKIIQASRDSRLAGDIPAAILTTLAAIFTPVNTVRGLAGAAAAVAGTSAVVQTDTFNGQAGEIITLAIETARQNQANQIRQNLLDLDTDQYSIYAAVRDVTDYHDMCSLSTALIQIRNSLRATAPDAGLTPPAAQGRQTSGGASPAAISALKAQQQIITEPNKPLPPSPPPPPARPNTFGRAEQRLPVPQIVQIQMALCVTPADGDLGPPDSKTRKAIREYLGLSPAQPVRLTPDQVTALGRVADTVGSCAAHGFRNAFEVRRYGPPLADTAASVKALQAKLRAKLADTPPVPDTGVLDSATRAAIQAAREKFGIEPQLDGQMDNQLDVFLTD
ncbi:MAG TPA: hypothetical protein VFW75_03860, partial [Acetobacteraceae bacterium]|nr:hypothetical protein [Acetobacteraceae bacterium]